jgi:hypothetical protein
MNWEDELKKLYRELPVEGRHFIMCENDLFEKFIPFIHSLLKRQWISVEDRLPEPMENVLVSLENGWTTLIGKYRNPEQGWTCFYADGEQIAYQNLVTHWMPLPEPTMEKK